MRRLIASTWVDGAATGLRAGSGVLVYVDVLELRMNRGAGRLHVRSAQGTMPPQYASPLPLLPQVDSLGRKIVSRH